jgi:hypothetical protein
MPAGELAEARADRDVLAHPAHGVAQRQGQRAHLDRDHLVERQRPPEHALRPPVDVAVAELLDDHVQPVDLRDGAVPVEDEVQRRDLFQRWEVTPAGFSSAAPACSAFSYHE